MDGIILYVGYGFSANYICQALKKQHPTIQHIGTTRDADKANNLSHHHITPILWQGEADNDNLIHYINHESLRGIVISIPPNDDDAFLSQYNPYMHAMTARNVWIGYLSTTGVYGNHNGAWVDEDTPPQPTLQRSKNRLLWEQHYQQYGAHIFRLGGIYGSKRNACASLQRGQRRIIKKNGQYFGRIHGKDIAQTIIASLRKPDPGRIYNVVDDMPSPPDEVLLYAASLMGITPPPIEAYDDVVNDKLNPVSPMALSFYQDNKRVGNARLKKELGINLHFPNYKKGLNFELKLMKSKENFH